MFLLTNINIIKTEFMYEDFCLLCECFFLLFKLYRVNNNYILILDIY